MALIFRWPKPHVSSVMQKYMWQCVAWQERLLVNCKCYNHMNTIDTDFYEIKTQQLDLPEFIFSTTNVVHCDAAYRTQLF